MKNTHDLFHRPNLTRHGGIATLRPQTARLHCNQAWLMGPRRLNLRKQTNPMHPVFLNSPPARVICCALRFGAGPVPNNVGVAMCLDAGWFPRVCKQKPAPEPDVLFPLVPFCAFSSRPDFDCDGRTGTKKHDSDTQTTQDVEAQGESGGRIPG
jgi:hypothetical protein